MGLSPNWGLTVPTKYNCARAKVAISERLGKDCHRMHLADYRNMLEGVCISHYLHYTNSRLSATAHTSRHGA